MAKLLGLLTLAAIGQAQRGGGSSGLAMLRFGCSELVISNLDPLVTPGQVPSPHVHQIVGGNAFNASMPVDDVSKHATCTSCTFTEDLSNYWTASVYFKARNGSYKRVPQMVNDAIGAANRGVTVYYTASGKGSAVAFKPGFRMFTGDALRTTASGHGRNMQSCFRCYPGINFQGNVQSPCFDPKLDTEGFPQTPCPGGIRSSVIYPLCWDGKNLDSPNHIDHVAHPVSGPGSFAVTTAQCPASHPVKIPQIHLEIVWNTAAFNNKEDWPLDGSQPLVLSTGDTTGYAQHGDYVFGWQGDSLQRAMDNGCFGPSCPKANLKTQSFEQANKCTVPKLVQQDYDGWVDSLPGLSQSSAHIVA